MLGTKGSKALKPGDQIVSKALQIIANYMSCYQLPGNKQLAPAAHNSAFGPDQTFPTIKQQWLTRVLSHWAQP